MRYTKGEMNVQREMIKQMGSIIDVMAGSMKKIDELSEEVKILKKEVNNEFTEYEEEIISEIFYCWFEDMTEELVNCTIHHKINGLKDELRERIQQGCGDHNENRLLLKLYNPSRVMIRKIDEMYFEIRRVFNK